MLLAVDVGNTNTVLGLFESGSSTELAENWRVATDADRTADEWMLLLGGLLAARNLSVGNIDGAVIASVVPKVTVALRRMFERAGAQHLVVDWSTDTGVRVDLENPAEVGADRLANAAAALEITPGPAIVVDMGTATTLDVLTGEGVYAGGVILPGLDISLDALFRRAAALRRVDLVAPPSVVGHSTVSAMQSGATYGFAAQVDGLCDRIENEVGICTVISTGGLASVITPLSRRIERHDPWLTLKGLRLIYERNAS